MKSVSIVSITLTALNQLTELVRSELVGGGRRITCFLWI